MGYRDTIELYLSTMQRDIRQNMNEEDANATGMTSNSIRVEAKEFSGQLTALDSLESAQEGTPPKDSGGGISLKSATTWISARGLVLSPERLTLTINEDGSFFFRNPNKKRDLYTSVFDDKKRDNEFYNNLLDDTIDELLNALG